MLAARADQASVFTIGHSTRSVEALVALLRAPAVDLLVDVRRFPRSRTNPQFNADVLPAALAEAGIGYRHLAALGGRRDKAARAGRSPNGLWREPAFRNYADYAATSAFREGFETLLALAREHRPAVMCAEALWWRCHRRIIADYLIASGLAVAHILGPGEIVPATLTPGAVMQAEGTLLYPPAIGELF